MIDDSTLPHRLRQCSFRKFENIIAEAIAVFPQTLEVSFEGNTNTYVCRLRDAMLSLYLYEWETKVDVNKFRSIYHTDRKLRKIHVCHSEGKVFIGTGEGLKTVEAGEEQINSNIVGEFSISREYTDTLPCRILIGHLVAKGACKGPLRLIGLTNDEAVWLEDNFDVSVKVNTDNSYTIL